MPKLNEYISVGYCAVYGDVDYRVSAAICNLDRKQIEELFMGMFHAQRVAWDIWSGYQDKAAYGQAVSEEQDGQA